MIGKRSLSLIIACIVILSVGVCGFAVGSRYSTDTFGVTLPVGAELCEKESGYYRWVDDETQSIISVRVDKNTNNLKPSNVDLYKFENSVADDIDNLISGTEVDKYFVLQDVKTEIVEIGDYDFIKTVCTMNLTYMGRVIPANMYIFGAITENYIHYFYIMNLSDGAESFADEIVESIVIKDEKVWDNWFGNIVSYISGLRPRRQARIINSYRDGAVNLFCNQKDFWQG